MKYIFSFSLKFTHTHTTQNPINQAYYWLLSDSKLEKLKPFSYLLISILSDTEFTSLTLPLSCLLLDNWVVISSCLCLCCHFLLLPGIL